MVRNSRARAMVQQQPDTKSGGSGHPGVVDPTNLGIDLGSTLGDTTSPQMMVGGTLELPVVDAGGRRGRSSAAELRYVGATISDAGVEAVAPTYQQPRCKEVTVLSRTTRRRCTTSSK
jgi:hypothetical protein